MRMRIVLISAAVVLLAVACGSTSGNGSINVVAAENVYGDIAAQIGGARVKVTSILTNPNADPHLFEPGTSTALAVAKADVIIENGLGYDAFMSRLENAAPKAGRVQLTIAQVLGVSGKNANPHLWYDVPRLDRVAGAIERSLARVDPGHASKYRTGLARFERSLRPLLGLVGSIRRADSGAPIVYTEPVPGYLIRAAGLRNLAPAGFTRPIEEGTEPSPSAVSQMLDLMRGHRVRVLLYNSQATSPITTQVRAAAMQAGIPVIGVTETLPPRMTFQEWQTGQARALARALHQ
jgi:zinc/manganese transport system substrate-binding protein